MKPTSPDPSAPSGNLTITRRTAIASATFVPLAALLAPSAEAQANGLYAAERRTLEAFVDRLIPKDEVGPGAVEAGVVDYIDRCMGGYLAAEKSMFVEGLTSVNAFTMRTQGAALADLSPEKRDTALTAIEQTPNLRGFFNRVRRLTLEGMFGDPSYGGNKNFAGWDLIRYPGAKLSTSLEDQSMKTPPKPYRKALYTGEAHGH